MLLRSFLFLIVFLSGVFSSSAQIDKRKIGQATNGDISVANGSKPNTGKGKTATSTAVAPEKRKEDSITISYKMFDSSRIIKLDSNLLNLQNRFPLPPDFLYLTNLGSAAHSVLFSPRIEPGFDAGFHAYDAYLYTLAGTKMYTTTKPYSELGYIIGPLAEQTINALTTQNIKPTWNMSFEYRLIAAPGTFKNVTNTHHNIRLSSAFVTTKRRYSGNFIFINNKITAGESGGIVNDTMLQSVFFTNRFSIPTRLGGDPLQSSNFFSSSPTLTGAHYKEDIFFFRHQYDFGQKDSVVSDSNVLYVFYPRFRLQHNLTISSKSYSFTDANSADSIRSAYGYSSLSNPIIFKDKWNEFTNEFAIILFPEKQNQNQFFKAGTGFQQLTGSFDAAVLKLSNFYLLGEYRNRTRNKKWDINANGKLYLAGYNAGDYTAQVQLQAELGKKFGTVQLGFQNTNQSPSFVTDQRSSFPLLGPSLGTKENITHIYGSMTEQKLKLQLKADYYAVANYIYWSNFYEVSQEPSLINVLRISAEKKFRLTKKHWNLYSELAVQQSTNSIIHIPNVFTHHRIAYEGNPFTNLFMVLGLDIKYNTGFKADDYSPLTGQFFLQNQTTISNRPDVAAFFHFRIKTFNGFIRMENLNTISTKPSLGFFSNNLAAPNYPMMGQLLRIGIKWQFIN